MIYIFAIAIIYVCFKQREKLTKQARNIILFLIIAIIGLSMGIIYQRNPYIPSFALQLERLMR